MIGKEKLEARTSVCAIEQPAVFLPHYHIPTKQDARGYPA